MSPRAGWLQDREESAGQRALRSPLLPLSWLYAGGTVCHRAWYERGPGRRTRLPCKVVSIGNLVVGGSGKTPLAAWLALALRRRGHRTALASRGYGRAGRERVDVVSDGRRVLGTAERCGDEPMLLAAHAPGVPVLVGPRRDTVGQRAVAAFGTELLILDDGFQHHRLARDVDLVVFPGAGLGNGSGLPRGPLREPLRTLRRADALLVMDGPLPEADARRLASAAPGLPSYAAFREPAGLRPLAGGPSREVSWLPDQSVGVLSGLARPHALRDSVAALGARVTAERCFPDHHRYREADLRGLAEQAKVWITSEKDAGKILPDWTHGAELWVLTQATRLPEQEAFLDWLQARLRARPAGRNSALEPRAAGGPR